MNRTYKLVWHATLQAWVVASELARSAKKCSVAGGATLLLGVAGQAIAAPATTTVPSGEHVISGSASFNRNVENRLIVRQASDKLITNWDSFDIGSRAQVIFVQPDASSTALNRVTSGTASQILGKLDANGQVLLVNPNGITFGAGAQVSAASIVASTMDIADNDFLQGKLQFQQTQPAATIVNQGRLSASNGDVVLLAGQLDNQGSIISSNGNILLGSGNQAGVTNSQLSVVSTDSSTGAVIRSTGVLQASSMQKDQGRIMLSTGSSTTGAINVRGTLDAAATSMDSYAITYLKGDTTVSGNLNIQSSYVSGWPGGVFLAGNLTLTGEGTELVIPTTALGIVFGQHTPDNQLNIQGTNSKVIVNDDVYHVVSNLRELAAIGRDKQSLSRKYLLGQDLDATETVSWDNGAGFLPIGSLSNPFKGSFSGLGHTIANLSIQRSQQDNVGLFGVASHAVIDNLNLKNINVAGANNVGGLTGKSINSKTVNVDIENSSIHGYDNVGGFLGFATGSSVQDTNSSLIEVYGHNNVGGVVGRSNNKDRYNGGFGTIRSDAFVSGYSRVGGIVGYSVYDGFATVSSNGKVVVETGSGGGVIGYGFNDSIDRVYSNVDVIGERAAFLGGVAGYLDCYDCDYSYLANSDSYGDVTRNKVISLSVKNGIGGVVGYSNVQLLDLDSYSSVMGGGYVGGVIGYNAGNSANNISSYAVVSSNESAGRNNNGFYGGVFGYNAGDVYSVYSYSVAKKVPNFGGVVGFNAGKIFDASMHWSDAMEVESNFGGIAYINNGYISGRIGGSIVANKNFGGIVNINNGDVYGEFNGYIKAKNNFGGFVNINNGIISWSSVDATIMADSGFGGFANINNGSIGGAVRGTIFHSGDFGDFVNQNSGTIGSSVFSGTVINTLAK